MTNMKRRSRKVTLLLLPVIVFVWAFGWILYNLESKNRHKTEKTIAPIKPKTPIGIPRSLAVEKPRRIDPNL